MKKFVSFLLAVVLLTIPSVALSSYSAEKNAGLQQFQNYDDQVVLEHAKSYVEKLRTVNLNNAVTTLTNVSLGDPIPIYRFEKSL